MRELSTVRVEMERPDISEETLDGGRMVAQAEISATVEVRFDPDYVEAAVEELQRLVDRAVRQIRAAKERSLAQAADEAIKNRARFLSPGGTLPLSCYDIRGPIIGPSAEDGGAQDA